MVSTCPRCGLISTVTAQRCDCGYDFVSGQMASSYLPQQQRGQKRISIAAFGCVGILLGALAGMLVGIELPLSFSEPGERFCGLFAVPMLMQRMMLGTVLGALTGLVSSVILACVLRTARRD